MEERIKWVLYQLHQERKTQGWLARSAGIREATLSQFLRGKQDIMLSTWEKIENVLKERNNE